MRAAQTHAAAPMALRLLARAAAAVPRVAARPAVLAAPRPIAAFRLSSGAALSPAQIEVRLLSVLKCFDRINPEKVCDGGLIERLISTWLAHAGLQVHR